MEVPTLSNLTITGDISMRLVPANKKFSTHSITFLIMGPTGAGKSTFIEALAGSAQNLGISRDQLAGYTQIVVPYQSMNSRWGSSTRPIYVVDSPGFSDTKISETEIVVMVRAWLLEKGVEYFDRILFLTPITEPRLPGSKRRTIEMLKALLQPSHNLGSVTFVTSMWDQVHNERTRQCAESNFSQLRDTLLKEFIDKGTKIDKFMNTRDSAMQILDEAKFYTAKLSATPASQASLYQDLHERIETALQQKKALESELADPEVQTDSELKSILQQNHIHNEETLAKFIGQLVRFSQPPMGFEESAQGLRQRIAAEVTPWNPRQKEIFDFWVSGATPSKLPADLYPDNPSRVLALKGILRRLLKASKRRGSKWFKRGA